MTQPKRTRGRTQKRGLSVEEFAYCDAQINGYFRLITDRYEAHRVNDDMYDFYFDKLSEWRDLLFVRGGVAE